DRLGEEQRRGPHARALGSGKHGQRDLLASLSAERGKPGAFLLQERAVVGHALREEFLGPGQHLGTGERRVRFVQHASIYRGPARAARRRPTAASSSELGTASAPAARAARSSSAAVWEANAMTGVPPLT